MITGCFCVTGKQKAPVPPEFQSDECTARIPREIAANGCSHTRPPKASANTHAAGHRYSRFSSLAIPSAVNQASARGVRDSGGNGAAAAWRHYACARRQHGVRARGVGAGGDFEPQPGGRLQPRVVLLRARPAAGRGQAPAPRRAAQHVCVARPPVCVAWRRTTGVPCVRVMTDGVCVLWSLFPRIACLAGKCGTALALFYLLNAAFFGVLVLAATSISSRGTAVRARRAAAARALLRAASRLRRSVL